ncbi:diguanylate cyclase [Clostridium tagluense]|uniref:diguanylate cyclase n=1 Tax=Clostridium tagluense TaxID=360422 RepID=UPI001CF5901D|nr:diguanylate cyclase [Clostridium tagluense]MCB2298579.1 GGDEF domain-containing protein [Clostridium tagluense]
MNKLKKLFFIIFIIFVLAIIFLFNNNTVLKSTKGTLNLKTIDYNQSKPMKIGGQWDLYFGKLLSPQQIQNKENKTYYNIPGRLSEQGLGNINTGYMTLHLKIVVPKNDAYGIKIDSMFTASDIWINGIYYGGHGRVGKNFAEEKSIYKPQYIFFNSNNEVVDIVINTSTFRDIEPNLKTSLFGTKDQLMNNLYKSLLLDITTNTILLFMFIFFAGSYFTINKKKENLYFAIMCFLMFLRGLFVNNRIFVQIFPNAPYELLSKIAALTFYLFITFYVLFLNDVFDNKIKFKKATIIFGTAFTALCLLTNNTVYDKMGIWGQIGCIIIIFNILYFLVMESYKKNKKAQSNLLSFAIISIATINDILVYSSISNNPYLIQYGMLVFVAIEFTLIMKDNSEEHKKLDKLNKDGMTGLYNNEYIKKVLTKEIMNDSTFSLIMIDIDDFKKINDNYGHLFGDRVITEVAENLQTIIGKHGYVSRYGGDEFLIVLPRALKEQAVNLSNLIRISVKDLNGHYDNNADVSLSIGVCENQAKTVDECINIVDDLLYQAKNQGKDCSVVS